MADKNITFRQKNTSGAYDKLYTKTTATQSKLSTATAALFGNNITDADAALSKVADAVKTIGDVRVKVVDPNGNPIQGARITGLYGTPTTASDGTAHGVLQTNPISISSPYIDLKDQTADASAYAGSFDVLTITLPIVGENNVKRITSSQTVKFKLAKTVDVCCVGGGGGGANYAQYYGDTVYQGSGGGGGGIVNAFGMTIATDENYQLYVGSGGATREAGQSDSSGYDGGSSNFLGISANGGGGGVAKWPLDGSQHIVSVSAGKAGYTGCGDGGYADGSGQTSNVGGSNTTVSEFNDNTTFYSGGGGSGSGARKAGGDPNGAAGAYQNRNTSINAGKAGVGGGGGGGMTSRLMSGSDIVGYASAGGPGLVAIRFHF